MLIWLLMAVSQRAQGSTAIDCVVALILAWLPKLKLVWSNATEPDTSAALMTAPCALTRLQQMISIEVRAAMILEFMSICFLLAWLTWLQEPNAPDGLS